MSTLDDTQPSKPLFYTGWALTAILSVFFLWGAINAWISSPQVIAGTARVGYDASFLHILAPIELVCALLYLIPRTAVFGALLLTAYLGGAVASHARIHDPQWPVPVVFGIIVWVALLLRRPTLRKLIL